MDETKAPNQAGPPSTEESDMKMLTTLKWGNIIATIIGCFIVLGPLYYFFIWKKYYPKLGGTMCVALDHPREDKTC